jgi:hypothetical protein
MKPALCNPGARQGMSVSFNFLFLHVDTFGPKDDGSVV